MGVSNVGQVSHRRLFVMLLLVLTSTVAGCGGERASTTAPATDATTADGSPAPTVEASPVPTEIGTLSWADCPTGTMNSGTLDYFAAAAGHPWQREAERYRTQDLRDTYPDAEPRVTSRDANRLLVTFFEQDEPVAQLGLIPADGGWLLESTAQCSPTPARGASQTEVARATAAAGFLRYARGRTDHLPGDHPVRLYLGNGYQSTVHPPEDGRAAWAMCVDGYAARTCPMSPLTVVSDPSAPPIVNDEPTGVCLAARPEQPEDTGGTGSLTLEPRDADCTGQYAVQLWFDDNGGITAVNLLIGEP
jgi:hypothetical protein